MMEIPGKSVVRIVVGFSVFLIILSFFTDFLPFLDNQPIIAKVMMIFGILVLSESVINVWSNKS